MNPQNLEKQLFTKNKDLILITTYDLTKQQLKAFNYIAYSARKQLQIDPKQREFYFSYSEVEDTINSSKTNNKNLYETLKKLTTINVELIKDSRNWAVFNLFGSVRRIDEQLQVGLTAPMCDCLIEKNYTTLDLKVIRNFNSKYTILFYEMYQQYKDINFPILSVVDFKRFLGIEKKKGYKSFTYIRDIILKPALQELAEKEKIYLDYRLTKKGKSYETIQFYITEKKDKFKFDSSPMTDDEIHIQFEKFKRENKNYQELMKSSKNISRIKPNSKQHQTK